MTGTLPRVQHGMGIAALAVLAACGSPGAPAGVDPVAYRLLPHRVLSVGQQCGRAQRHLEQVADLTQLRRLVDGESLSAGPAGLPKTDLMRETVLWLGMGELRSSGGQVTVTRVEAEPASRRLRVHTQWTLPEPGQLHAMVVTRPCVVFAVPAGEYRAVQVLDASGRERLATEAAVRP